MKKLLTAVLLLSFASFSYADAIRCGNRLAKTGDAKGYVIEVCGQPISEDLVSWENDVAVYHLTYKENGNLKVLIFKGGILTSIIDAKK